MDAQRITYNFVFAPANFSSILSSKVKTKGLDPIPILLYTFINISVMTGFLFLFMKQFYDDKFAMFSVGAYVLLTSFMGVMIGTVDQIFGLF